MSLVVKKGSKSIEGTPEGTTTLTTIDEGQQTPAYSKVNVNVDVGIRGPRRSPDISNGDVIDSASSVDTRSCLPQRLLQKLVACCCCHRRKPVEGDVQVDQIDDTLTYPRTVRFLQHPIFDLLVVSTAILSIFCLVFAEGFIQESRALWGIMHTVNIIFTVSLGFKWLAIVIKSQTMDTDLEYTTRDVVISVICVMPLDVLILALYIGFIDPKSHNRDNPVRPYLSLARVTYVLRYHYVFNLFAKWEDQLATGEFGMFVVRIFLYTLTILHVNACLFHRIACDNFKMVHLSMSPLKATEDVCHPNGWIMQLLTVDESPLLRHGWNVILEHYLVSMYWSVVTCFRLGSVEVAASLLSDWELAYVSITLIVAWIFFVVVVSGALTSILVEDDTERQNFLSRRFAIDRYLDFSKVTRSIREDVNRFYDYLWSRSKGIHNWDMIDVMPMTMRSEIYYNLNKFILDQLPLLVNLEESFLMTVACYMKHTFYLRGEILRRRGESGTGMFYVINGHLEVLNEDDTQPILEIRSGSAIGEIYLLQSYPRVATVRCGTECDIMALGRDDFKKVMNLYPEYESMLLQRLQDRFDQADQIISLCTKHNEYPKALIKYKDAHLKMEADNQGTEIIYPHKGSEIVKDALKSQEDRVATDAYSDDYDGLEIDEEAQKRLTKHTIPEKTRKSIQKDAAVGAYLALEADVTRAASLAKDLKILRPPLNVAAPSVWQAHLKDPVTTKRLTSSSFEALPTFSKKVNKHSFFILLFKTLVFCSGDFVIWYYTYMFGFGNRYKTHYWDYIAHICDFIFAIDFLFDNLQPVITHRKTLESHREILTYQVHTCYFYVRLFSFLPIEYIMGPALGITSDTSRYYYCFKFNRLLQYIQCQKYFKSFETNSRVASAPQYFVGRIALRIFGLVHLFAVTHEVILTDFAHNRPSEVVPDLGDMKKRNYMFNMYWAIQVISSTGYGDIPSRSDAEVVVTAIGVIIGSCMVIFLFAKISAIFSHFEHRRVTFKQTFYLLMNFMRQRNFPSWLHDRVKKYYQVQWKAHEGVFIPHAKPVIWDAPKSLFENVSLAQSVRYVSSIPLFRYCSDSVIIDACTNLRHYIVPPNEVILYATDRARDLYIIVNGFCEVRYENFPVGYLTEGQYFGIPGLIYGKNRPIRITTLTHCRFFCLDFESFIKIAEHYPMLLHDYKVLRGEATLPLPSSPSSEDKNPNILSHYGNEIPTPMANLDFPPLDVNHASLKRSAVVANPSESQAPNLSQDVSFVSNPSVLTDHVGQIIPVPGSKRDPNVCRFLLIPKTILPTGPFLKWWTLFRVLSGFLVTNFAIIQLAFAVSPLISFYVMLVFDIIAWTDLYLSLHIGYFGPLSQLISNRIKTASHYLKGSFLVDLVACFPLDYLVILSVHAVQPFGPNPHYGGYYSLISCLRLNRMIQCYRLFLSAQYLGKSIFRSLSFITIVQVAPKLLLFLNVATCLSVLAVCNISVNGEALSCEPDAWLSNGDVFKYVKGHKGTLLLEDAWRAFVVGIYWVSTSAFCVGFGDIDIIHGARNREIAFTIIFLGLLVTGYLMAKLTACLIGEDSRKMYHSERFDILQSLYQQLKLDIDLQRRVTDFFSSVWDKTKGINPKDLFSALPPVLKADVLKNLYETSILKCPLFASLDESGVRILASTLNEVFYPEGEYIAKAGDLDDDVFLIAHGIVGSYNNRGSLIYYVESGSLIGEVSAIMGVERLWSAVAATDVKLFLFKKKDFMDFLSRYPTIKDIIERASVVHYQQMIDSANAELLVKVTSETLSVQQGVSVLTVANDKVEVLTATQEQDQHAGSASATAVGDELKGLTGDRASVSVNSKFSTVTHKIRELGELNAGGLGVESDYCKAEYKNFLVDPLRVLMKEDSFQNIRKKEQISLGGQNPFITFGRVPRDEMGLVHVIQERDKTSILTFLIHPASPLCTWVTFFLLLSCFSVGLTAYELAFSTRLKGEPEVLKVLRYTLEIFFVLRIIGSFHMAYYDDGGVLITNIGKISKRYLCRFTGFPMDFVATFPFYLVSYFVGDFGRGPLAADIRSLQLLRMVLFVFYFKEQESSRTSRIKVVKITILLCFIFHFGACIWYLVACDGLKCSKGSWMDIVLKNMVEKGEINKVTDITVGSRYLLSLYYITTAITFTGLSEITPRTTIEMIATIATIFSTIFVIAFLVGSMTQSLASQAASKMHFRHRLSVLEQHFIQLGLGQDKIAEVRRYFRLLWSKCNGFTYASLLAEIPYGLRADLLHQIYGPHIKSSRVFCILKSSIIRQLCSRIRPEIFTSGARIIRSRDVCVAVYFITKGQVVILDNLSMKLSVEILNKNECFGDVKVLLPREQYRFSYVARTETDIGVLYKSDIEDIFNHYPGAFEAVFGRANRVKSHRAALKAHKDHLLK